MRRAIGVFLAGLFLLFLPVLALTEVEEKGLIAHWKFEEGEGEIVKDSSGHGHDGQIIKLGEYTKWVEGRFGKALYFSGKWPEARGENGGVTIRNMDYDFSQGMTIEAWVKPGDKYTRPVFHEIITNTVADRGPGFRLIIFFDMLTFRSGDREVVWGASSATAKHPIRKNVWYHVAGTYDGSVFRVFINGEEAGVSEENKSLTTGRNIITIGSYGQGAAYPFQGTIDEVKIYNYPKTALDILKAARGVSF